ncbi:MAG: tRNA (adenosine(37)-N6)-dimethylallyltransferase MiaA [Candidatus Puniceispirillaceae bacterium]
MERFLKQRDYIIIAGPTAGGKSAYAVALAKALDGVIINADSMQVYADLSVLTARPSAADEADVPHRLYGEIDGAVRFSAGMWLEAAKRHIKAARSAGKWPILVGGTGFYLRAAEQGLSAIPDIPDNVRAEVVAEHAQKGGEAMLAYLAEVDPDIASRLVPGDSQRLIRATEVYRHTGIALSKFQKQPPTGGLSGKALKITHLPPREVIYDRINTRFDEMMATTALAEVEKLLARNLAADLPVMKALGVSALRDYLQGKQSLEQATYLAKRDSRHYAKRQMTWLRNNFITNLLSEELYSERNFDRFFSKILKMI